MFTGIVHTIGTVVEVIKNAGLLKYSISFAHKKLETGASVSIDGVCQTVVQIEADSVWFDAISETLECTTLNSIKVDQKVNVERACKVGDEVGGHLLSGHVYGKAILTQIENNIYTFQCSPVCIQYLFSKGFIALDGVSLTLVDVKECLFTVHFIPETLKRTTFRDKKVGDMVNLELDSTTVAVVETVERLVSVKREF